MEGQSAKYMAKANDDTGRTRLIWRAGTSRQDKVVQGKWWARSTDRRWEQGLRQKKLDRLLALGIYPDRLAGRLRLVISIGCYGDFRFTLDILSSSLTNDKIDRAIDVLTDLGAHCDCGVFRAIGQVPRALLWHHPNTNEEE